MAGPEEQMTPSNDPFIFITKEAWEDVCSRLKGVEKEMNVISARLDALDLFQKLHDDIMLLTQAVQGLTDQMLKNAL